MLLAGSSALATTALMTTGARAQGAAQTGQTAGNGKPNIVVIWGDDIGISNLSCYSMGVMGYRTPNIDRIAREGMLWRTELHGWPICLHHRAERVSHGAVKGGRPRRDRGTQRG